MSLSAGDRRWAIKDGRVVEFLFVDQDDTQVRVLLPSEFPEGQAITLGGHPVKVSVVRAKSSKSGQAITTYPVGSTNAQVQTKIGENGSPTSMPAINAEIIEQYSAWAHGTQSGAPVRTSCRQARRRP